MEIFYLGYLPKYYITNILFFQLPPKLPLLHSTQGPGWEQPYTLVPKEIFPLHFMFYRGNLDYFLNSVLGRPPQAHHITYVH